MHVTLWSSLLSITLTYKSKDACVIDTLKLIGINSVGSAQDFESRGPGFDPRLGCPYVRHYFSRPLASL